MQLSRTAAAALVLPLLLGLASSGCRISSDSSKGKNNDSVKVATPFGGLQIKTNDAAADASVGLPTYPGATLIHKDENKDDNGSADINMSFGSFHLRVKAVSYRTPDSPDKVEAFYRGALHRYGDVIQCSGNHAVGKPDHTPEGLTCNDDDNNGNNPRHFSINGSSSSKLQFKAGSKKHQHIVSVEPEGAGTKFSLIALDLPGTDSGSSKEQADSED